MFYGPSELKTKLEKLAYQITQPFCYHCYKTAPTGVCESCHSDDLMRELSGDGVEYGTDWRCAVSDHTSHLIDDDRIFEFKGKPYWIHEVEAHLDERLADEEAAS
jgi:hypothetical protein